MLGNSRHRRGVGRVLVTGIVAILVVAGASVYFLYLNPSTSGGIGTSSIQLGQQTGTAAAGGTMTVPYTVALASGSKWGTTLLVSNEATLAGDGITATPSTGTMDPTYSGTLSIATSTTTAPGDVSDRPEGHRRRSFVQQHGVHAHRDPAGGTTTSTTSSSTSSTTTSSYCTGTYCY